MKILYLSTLVSPLALREAEKKDSSFSAYASHKFHELVTQGLMKNGADVLSLSSFYLPKVGFGYRRKPEFYNGVKYEYIPSPNYALLRHLWLTVYCFIRVALFSCGRRKKKALICDVLNISSCIGALVAARLFGLRRIGIVTDMPEDVVTKSTRNGNENVKLPFATRQYLRVFRFFTHFVFLTEQMNTVLNPKLKPYIIMEGLVDSSFVPVDNPGNRNSEVKTVIYAGGLDERYGLRMLVEGFIDAKVPNSELHLYGDGPFAPFLKKYSEEHPAVLYKGIQPNGVIVEREQEATLLVNPRPTTEEFTKYSFPSKNMEYMLSGTPVLTTKLPGMPKEYYPYVFLFEDETVSGYESKIHEILSMPDDELRKKGQDARQWVFEQKNNIIQTKRILELISM